MKKIFVATLTLSFLFTAQAVFASIDANLQYGSNGSEVSELQNFLIQKGFLTGQATGNFFSLTKKAVIAYQKSAGLPATGFVGPLTRATINLDTIPIVIPATVATTTDNSNSIIVPIASSQTVIATTTVPTQPSVQDQITSLRNQYDALEKSVNGCMGQVGRAQITCNEEIQNEIAIQDQISELLQLENSNVPVSTNGYQICSDEFPNETWDGTYGSNGKYNCVCQTGYTWDSSQNSCQVSNVSTQNNSNQIETLYQQIQNIELSYNAQMAGNSGAPIFEEEANGRNQQLLNQENAKIAQIQLQIQQLQNSN